MSLKKFNFILLFMIIGKYVAFAQCNVSIPSNAIVVDTTVTYGGSNMFFWICGAGDTLNGSGVNMTYYVESGGVLNLSGIEKIVYLKNGATINCSGIDDTIYYESGAIIFCSGNGVLIPCATIQFDYSNGPPNGCFSSTSINETDPEEDFSLFPNPVDQVLNISYSGKKSLEIYNIQGKLINRIQNAVKGTQISVDVSQLLPGFYLIKMENQIRKFVKL
jgi:hypothetical protein